MTHIENRKTDVMEKELVRAFMPICSLDYRRIRSFSFEENSSSTIPMNLSHICQSGDKLYMVQDGRIWIGEIRTMIFDSFISFNFPIYGIEPLSDGIVIMSGDGFYHVGRSGDPSKVVTESLKSFTVKFSVHGSNSIFGITSSDEIFICSMVFPQSGGSPFPMVKILSTPIRAITWGAKPGMVFCDGTLWVSNEHDIYGFKNGGWKRNLNFPSNTINMIGSFEDNLVISFYDAPTRVVPVVDVDFDVVEVGVIE